MGPCGARDAVALEGPHHSSLQDAGLLTPAGERRRARLLLQRAPELREGIRRRDSWGGVVWCGMVRCGWGGMGCGGWVGALVQAGSRQQKKQVNKNEKRKYNVPKNLVQQTAGHGRVEGNMAPRIHGVNNKEPEYT